MTPRELEDRHASGFYPKRPLTLVRGEGCRVWDEDGRAYLDFTSGHGVVNIGHAHPRVAAAVAEQMRAIVTVRETFYHPLRGRLYGRLADLTGGVLDRIFLANSGTEAVECALKVARLATGRTEVVAAKKGFHGRTMGSLSLTWEKKYREPFEPLVPGAHFVAYNRPEELDAAIGERTAAVLLEVVQGEGGVHPIDTAFLARAAELCRERGALLLLDEIQSGLGRTGKMLACEHFGVTPDLLILGKGLAGGLPVGATLIGKRVPPLPTLAHGSTMGGGPVVCAAALAALAAIDEEGMVENARARGEEFGMLLAKLGSPLVREVRGLGLMVGVELKRRSGPFLDAMAKRGVLALAAGPNVIRMLPPLVVTSAEIETAVTALGEALHEVGERGADEDPGH